MTIKLREYSTLVGELNLYDTAIDADGDLFIVIEEKGKVLWLAGEGIDFPYRENVSENMLVKRVDIEIKIIS